MIINRFKSKKLRIYTLGKEKNYLGNKIEYDDSFITFLYLYQNTEIRLYIINGKIHERKLPFIEEKINLIVTLYNKDAIRFRRFLNEKLKIEDTIYYFPPIFFREIISLIKNRNYITILDKLYKLYKEEVKNGTHYPDI